MSKPELVTERLVLRPVEASDADALHSLWTDEHVRQYLWDGEVIPFAQTREIIDASRALFDESGFGIWGTREIGSDELIGFTGYWHFRTPPVLELLFGVAPSHWSRGIATESSRCLMRYGFEELGFGEIEASTDRANVASMRVLERLGMTRDRIEVVEGLDTVFYRLLADRFPGAS